MIPIVGLLLLGSAHTILAAESVDAQIPVAVEVHIPQNVTTSETPTVILKPESGAPMPSGAKDQATLTFPTAGGKMTFPAITFICTAISVRSSVRKKAITTENCMWSIPLWMLPAKKPQ